MKKVIAISGGVDSMLLAYMNRYKDVVLAFVNYNVREDTNIDEKIVTDFAKKYNLKLEKLILNKNITINKNFENWAREIRYDFFQKIYYKYQCSELLIAHHKDDFLETCLMQEIKNKNKLFYGIKKRTTLNKMKINRPFLFKYWKSEIYELATKNNILYHDDYTNLDNKYQRNKIRNLLKNESVEVKQKKIDEFIFINKMNEPIIKSIKNEYHKWAKSKFNINYFINLFYKEELVKLFINKRLNNINLNKNIINNIILFLKSKKGLKFLLSNNNYLIKKNGRLFVIKSK